MECYLPEMWLKVFLLCLPLQLKQCTPDNEFNAAAVHAGWQALEFSVLVSTTLVTSSFLTILNKSP